MPQRAASGRQIGNGLKGILEAALSRQLEHTRRNIKQLVGSRLAADCRLLQYGWHSRLQPKADMLSTTATGIKTAVRHMSSG